jgi:16S rRNA (cytidine1402-2'-O)-methyltransferase
MSLRAVDVLSQVDLIAAEDTRVSKVLLRHYGIMTALISYHDFNEEKIAPLLLSKLKANQALAIISDAGTPGISDPAFYLVRQAIQAGIRVEAIPGATAFVPALIISGLPTDRFVFEGFLPVKKGRNKRLEELRNEPRTVIIYESPRRIDRTLKDLLHFMGDRQVAIVREITKKFEQIIRGSFSEVTERLDEVPRKGEFVIIVGGLTRKLQRMP